MEQIREWLKDNNRPHRILITGKMGTGKTTLIKGLTKGKIDGAMDSDNLEPHTIDVTPYPHDHEGLHLILFDTPGLKDPGGFTNDYTYLKEMVMKNGEPDLVIFAIKMNDYVFRDEDAEAIANVSNAFGWRIWKNAMFILTFANMVTEEGHSPESVESKLHFSTVYNTHYYHIAKALRSNMVQDDVINSISVVPVGLLSQPIMQSDKRGVSWISEFWEEALKVLKTSRRTYDSNGGSTQELRNQDSHKEQVGENSSWW